MEPPFQIWVTTYEIGDGLNKTLSHVFYGNTLEEAVGVAKSHLITDYFFSSSFIGRMPWKGGTLYLTNQGQVINIYNPSNTEEIQRAQKILDYLDQEARRIHNQQDSMGLSRIIRDII
jgi:hypothetical protein